MTPKEFRKLVAAYGGNLSRWPEGERSHAAALSATPELRGLLAEASRLDAALQALGAGSALGERRLHDLIRRAAREIGAAAPAKGKAAARPKGRAPGAEDC
jgi:hypothetical protein